LFDITIKMAALIALGAAWRVVAPGQMSIDTIRNAITDLVYFLFLPCLVLSVLWQTPLGLDSLRISLVALAGVGTGMLLSLLVYRLVGVARPTTGALVLAAAFPNATYMGLPVLEAVFGPWARSVAIQYDLFACFPALITVGILLAKRFGTHSQGRVGAVDFLKTPPLVAAIVAVLLNQLQVPQPPWLLDTLQTIGGAVVPLMLISLGMSLIWRNLHWKTGVQVFPVLVIQLLIMPVTALFVATNLGLNGDLLTAVVLEAAMPCMVLGIVFCDRFGLDSPAYASAVTLSTLISLATLPLWLDYLS
jgi:predicted permease